jgi:hypothetical protein
MAQVRSSCFQLVVAPMECFSCHAQTQVGAIVAPVGAEAMDDEGDEAQWESSTRVTPLSSVQVVSDGLAARLSSALPTMRLDHSNTADLTYWINHCSQCGMRIGDWHTQTEPDGPFFAWPRGGKIGDLKELGEGEVTSTMPYF